VLIDGPGGGRRSRTTTSAGVVAALVLLFAPATEAQPKQGSDFDKLVETGGKHFRDGEYADARAAWQEAYNLNPDPTLLFNIGSTFRREAQKLEGAERIARLEEALSYYQRYLEVAPANAQHRGVAGEAVLNVQTQIDTEKAAAQPPPPPPAPRSSGGSGGKILKWSGIGLGVLGLASLSFGIFQGLEAQDLNDKFESLPDGTEWTQELQDDFDRGQSLETQAIAFSIAGGVAVAIGASLYIAGVFAAPDGGAERSVAVTPVVSDDQAGLALSGRF
jgi:tetratricopeptide (TPR) repeat protein